ncbi:MAG: hypothetical protein SOY06_03620 [Prevotella sp.]|nr:hypothetical protein [Bacteroidales bacterium]MDD6952671.1 hypothetical protein [Prevotella sp.]MDY4228919.1 hypothetical protein [Prevotella sp.]
MADIMISSLSPKSQIEGTLLTPEQVEEISSRISKNVFEKITKQLDKSLASSLEKNKNK